jgi:hypothetical protein
MEQYSLWLFTNRGDYYLAVLTTQQSKYVIFRVITWQVCPNPPSSSRFGNGTNSDPAHNKPTTYANGLVNTYLKRNPTYTGKYLFDKPTRHFRTTQLPQKNKSITNWMTKQHVVVSYFTVHLNVYIITDASRESLHPPNKLPTFSPSPTNHHLNTEQRRQNWAASGSRASNTASGVDGKYQE